MGEDREDHAGEERVAACRDGGGDGEDAPMGETWNG